MNPPLEMRRLDLGRRLSPSSRVALTGRTLAAATADRRLLLWPDISDEPLRARDLGDLEHPPGEVALSPSGRHLLVWPPDLSRVVLRDVPSGAKLAEFAASERWQRFVTAGFTRAGEGEALVVSHLRGRLEGYLLPGMEPLFVAPAERRAPQFRRVYPALGDGDTFFVVARHFAESVVELITLSLRELAVDGGAPERELLRQPPTRLAHRAHVSLPTRRIRDTAYELAAGPCGPSEAVFFRDHEDAEAPDDEDEDDRVHGDLEDFNGLYVRRVEDGALVERIPCALPVPTGAPLFGTPSIVAAVLGDRIEIIPRVAGAARATIPGQAFWLDAEAARVAVVTAKGDLDLVDLHCVG